MTLKLYMYKGLCLREGNNFCQKVFVYFMKKIIKDIPLVMTSFVTRNITILFLRSHSTVWFTILCPRASVENL